MLGPTVPRQRGGLIVSVKVVNMMLNLMEIRSA
jgi:hypothetical protein